MASDQCYEIDLSAIQQKDVADAICKNRKIRNIIPFAANYSTELGLSHFHWVTRIFEHHAGTWRGTARNLGQHAKAVGIRPIDKILLTVSDYEMLKTKLGDNIIFD